MDLYSEIILDHYYHPRMGLRLSNPTTSVEEFNPICGAKVVLDILVDEGVCKSICIATDGCAICCAAGSMLAEKISGSSIDTIESLNVDDVMQLLNIPINPARAKCALLGWSALRKALKNIEV